MACGEGYGSAVLAGAAAQVVGVDGNPEAHEHARLRYTRPGLSFEWGAVETFGEAGAFDAVVFLQTIEHVVDPPAVLQHFRGCWHPAGSPTSRRRTCSRWRRRAREKSDNPWHLREYRAEEFARLCRGVFGQVEMLGLFHARKLRAHEVALRLGWDRVHTAPGDHQGVLRPLHAGDLRRRLRTRRPAPARPGARFPGGLPLRPARRLPSGTFAATSASGSPGPGRRRPPRWRARSS